ncbi:MAG: DUF4038 domain-containing protein [Pseudonocardia sp.]
MSRRVCAIPAASPRLRRFAPHSLVAAIVLGAVLAWGGQPVPNPSDQAVIDGPLRVGADGRSFTGSGGEPFFWLADTAWSLFTDLSRSEAQAYLDARDEQGFTVIQTAVLVGRAGGARANQYGDRPLTLGRPDVTEGAGVGDTEYDYWDHVDFVIAEAARRGLVVGLRPVWGDVDEPLTADQADALGRFLDERYGESPVVWMLDGSTAEVGDAWPALAAGERLDVQLLDSRRGARCRHEDPSRDVIGTAYGSGRPFVDGEPVLEGEVLCRDGEGYATPLDVRRDAYGAVFGGAAGYTYGHRAVAQFGSASDGRGGWSLALQAPGAIQMRHLRALVESRPRLEPDAGRLVGSGPIQAALAPDGSTAMAYTATGQEIDLDLDALSGYLAQPWWYDPRTGEALGLAAVPSSGTVRFSPPGAGSEQDWVLVVDDVDARRAAPGEPAGRDGSDLRSAPEDLSGAAGHDLDAPSDVGPGAAQSAPSPQPDTLTGDERAR